MASKTIAHPGRQIVQEGFPQEAEQPWEEGVDLSSHLLSAIQNISNNWWSQEGEEYLESEFKHNNVFGESITEVNPERILQAREMLERIEMLFSHDDIALRVINLLGLGYPSEDVQQRIAIAPKQYRAIMSRIRLTLQEECPEYNDVRSDESLVVVLSQVFSDLASI